MRQIPGKIAGESQPGGPVPAMNSERIPPNTDYLPRVGQLRRANGTGLVPTLPKAAKGFYQGWFQTAAIAIEKCVEL